MRLAAAVHETLSPFMSEMREGLAAVRTDMREGLAAVRTDMREGLAAVRTEMREGLAAVRTEMREGLAAVKENVTSIQEQMDALTDSVLTNVTEELRKTADYMLEHAHTYECGGSGGWRRVVYLNMTDPNTNCPSGWQLTSYFKRKCSKVRTSRLSCDSVFFPVSGGDYTSVCGSIRAYQYGPTDAFYAFHTRQVTTIEGAYVSGVSLTHGSPRQHIWTFAAGALEYLPTRVDICPCDANINITIPPFVGGDYFCESGANSGRPSVGFYPEDPLWDGQGCSNSSTCCSFNNPPYFTKQLPSPTSDPIEARLCKLDGADDSPVDLMDLYVK